MNAFLEEGPNGKWQKTCPKCETKFTTDTRDGLLEFFYLKASVTKDGFFCLCKKCHLLSSKISRHGKHTKNIRKQRANNPIQNKARSILNNAIALRKVFRKPCERCGAAKVDGHHEDYSKPLDVTWLCRKHHAERHREIDNA